MEKVTFDRAWVVDGGADLKIGAALWTHADIDLKDALQQSSAAAVFDFFLVNGDEIEALARLWLENNEIPRLAV